MRKLIVAVVILLFSAGVKKIYFYPDRFYRLSDDMFDPWKSGKGGLRLARIGVSGIVVDRWNDYVKAAQLMGYDMEPGRSGEIWSVSKHYRFSPFLNKSHNLSAMQGGLGKVIVVETFYYKWTNNYSK